MTASVIAWSGKALDPNLAGTATLLVGHDITDIQETQEKRVQMERLAVVGTDLTDEAPRFALAHHPVAVSEQLPMSCVAKQPRPDLFASLRAPADEPRDCEIAPQRDRPQAPAGRHRDRAGT